MTPEKKVNLNLSEFEPGKFKLVFPQDAPFDEVTDSLRDVITVVAIVEKELGDGFQWPDLFALLQAQPIVNEIIRDVSVFIEQFLQLSPDNSITAVIQARQMFLAAGGVLGKASTFILRLLYGNANSYLFAETVYTQGLKQVQMYNAIFAGKPVFPDELEE